MASDLQDGEDVVCVACQHAWSSHDQIAARFCAASASSGLDRGCVCTG
ncbi:MULTISPECIES: RGCVC family protein [Crossiella]